MIIAVGDGDDVDDDIGDESHVKGDGGETDETFFRLKKLVWSPYDFPLRF